MEEIQCKKFSTTKEKQAKIFNRETDWTRNEITRGTDMPGYYGEVQTVQRNYHEEFMTWILHAARMYFKHDTI